MLERRYKLFNAGDRIQTPYMFSNPDGHDIHVLCRFNFDAPAGGVCTIPDQLTIGVATVHVTFLADILRDYGPRGVVLIDANWEPPLKNEERYDEERGEMVAVPSGEVDQEASDRIPMARTLDEAKAKGQRVWRGYIEDAVKRHMEQCEAIRAAGGVPIAAAGFVKRALKLAGYIDPAEAMMIEVHKQTQALETLRDAAGTKDKQIEALTAAVQALTARVEAAENREAEPVGGKKR